MPYYTTPAKPLEYYDPLAPPEHLTSSKKSQDSASNSSSLATPLQKASSSNVSLLNRPSLVGNSSAASAPKLSAPTAAPVKEPGSVVFSFEKPSKPAVVPQSALGKSRPSSNTTGGPVLPPTAASSSVHKPGGLIAFTKPIVTPKKSSLISGSYSSRSKTPDSPSPPPSPPPPATTIPSNPTPNAKNDSKSSSHTQSNGLAPSKQPEERTPEIAKTPSPNPPSVSSVQPNVGALKACGPPSYGVRTLDSYKILEMISEGAYGIVYKAVDTETGDIVALKRVKVDPLKEKETGFPVSSIREIRALAHLRHDHVVSMRDLISDSSGANIYLVMDYIPHDLHQMLKKHLKKSLAAAPNSLAPNLATTSGSPSITPAIASIEPLFTIANAKSLMHDLLLSMAFLHSKNFMHRDIKSSNLLVSDQGKLYLADFGLAKEWTATGKAQRTPTVVTITYRAPELAFGAPDYNVAIDMWSVGLVMAEILSGRELMRGVKNELELMARLVEIFGSPNEVNYGKGFNQLSVNNPKSSITLKPQPENRLRSFFPQLSRQGFDLLSRLLCYDPEKRITADQALAHAWFKELPVAVRPVVVPPKIPTPPPQVPPFKPAAPSSSSTHTQYPHFPPRGPPVHPYDQQSHRPMNEPYYAPPANRPPPPFSHFDPRYPPPTIPHYMPFPPQHVPYSETYHGPPSHNASSSYGRFPPHQQSQQDSRRPYRGGRTQDYR